MNDQKTILQPLQALLGKSATMVHVGANSTLVMITHNGNMAGRARIYPWGGYN